MGDSTSGSPLLLGPLPPASVEALVADSVHVPVGEAAPLAAFVLDRTGGNPFFVHQLVERLALDGAIRFDATTGHWTWDLEEALACGVTDDVAKLMTERVDRLPEATRELLQIGACVRAVFDLDTVATVLGHDMATTARHLEPAFAAGLILPLDASYKYAAEEAEVARLRGVRGRNNPRYRFLHERTPIHLIRIGVGVAQLRYREGTHLAVDVLRDEFGIRLPKDPITPHVIAGLLRLKLALRGRDPQTLLDLQTLTDPDVHAALGTEARTRPASSLVPSPVLFGNPIYS